MRILLVQPHIFVGGAEKAIVYLSHNLGIMGHKVSIATLSKDLLKLPDVAQHLDYITPEVERPPPHKGELSSTISRVIKETVELHDLLKEVWKNYDICVPGNFPAYWATYFLKRQMPILWICSEVLGPYGVTKNHYDKNRIFRSFFKAASFIDRQIVKSGVHEIVTCSDLCKVMIKERYGKEANTIHTAVDYDYFSQEINQMEAKKKLCLEDDYILLHVGSMIKRKNQLLSLQVIKQLLADMPDLRLIFVGRGPDETMLREKAKHLGLGEHVIFTGEVNEEMLKTLYYACDLNLYPVEDQTWGLVPFEALACGKPSIVSLSSGAAHLLKNIDAAILTNPTVEEIVEAIKCVRNGKIDLENMVKRGRRFVSENLTWESYSRDVSDILEKTHDRFLRGNYDKKI